MVDDSSMTCVDDHDDGSLDGIVLETRKDLNHTGKTSGRPGSVTGHHIAKTQASTSLRIRDARWGSPGVGNREQTDPGR